MGRSRAIYVAWTLYQRKRGGATDMDFCFMGRSVGGAEQGGMNRDVVPASSPKESGMSEGSAKTTAGASAFCVYFFFLFFF